MFSNDDRFQISSSLRIENFYRFVFPSSLQTFFRVCSFGRKGRSKNSRGNATTARDWKLSIPSLVDSEQKTVISRNTEFPGIFVWYSGSLGPVGPLDRQIYPTISRRERWRTSSCQSFFFAQHRGKILSVERPWPTEEFISLLGQKYCRFD